MRNRRLLYNTLLLTATSLLMRTVGLLFQIYLSKKVGAAGIGLFSLVLSVSWLAATFAISGIRFTTVRIVSERLGLDDKAGARKAVIRCLAYAAIFGTAATVILLWGSSYIGTVLVGDARTVLGLRVLSISLPFMSMSCVLSGYFTAVCRVLKSSAVAVVEQAIRIAVIVAALSMIDPSDLELSCAIIVGGGAVGELGSFLLLLGLYLGDKAKHLRGGRKAAKGLTAHMLGIALPLALSAYARAAFSTMQNLLVPRGLRKSGHSQESSLAAYGMIQGMVFPIITFPAALFTALAELIVPELTEDQVGRRHERIKQLVTGILKLCLLFSIGVAGLLFFFADELGTAIYSSREAGLYIRYFAALVPLMYLDHVTDGMLRGLGEHMYTMYVNIVDSFVCVLLVYFLLPRYAIEGYIFILYLSEAVNFAFSIGKLIKVAHFHIHVGTILKALLAFLGAFSVSSLLLRLAGLELAPSAVSLVIHTVLTGAVYYLLLLVLRCLNRQDTAGIRSAFSLKLPGRQNEK